ncbi:glycosyltransferase [Curvivirga sp.]|uniref:glycosyltransferase n=1 Tax=Curvivirga sp. TaxID=2856848 RepID=UPI003B5C06CA
MRDSTKILYVIGSLDRGGCETHLLKILPRLKEHGYDISIFLLSKRGSLANEFEKQGVFLIEPWYKLSTKATSKFSRALRLLMICIQLVTTIIRGRPDIIHFFLPASYWIGGTISLLFPRLKKVMSRRSMNHYMAGKKIITSLERQLHQKMDYVLGNSKAVVEQLHQEGAPSYKVDLIYNGIEHVKVNKERKALRKELQIPESTVVMTMVANLIPYKGHMDLIHALGRLSKTVEEDWHVLLVGRDDGIAKELQKEANQLGILGNITFLGARDDVVDIYNASDIGVLVSHEEGFSNAVLEAMSAGLPMLVTDVGGNAEAVQNGDAGLVVEAKDINGIFDGLRQLVIDKSMRDRMGTFAKKRIENSFSLEQCVYQYHKLYQKTLTQK